MFKADPGVVPDDDICAQAGITVVRTLSAHRHERPRTRRGQVAAQGVLANFLDDDTPPNRLAPDAPATTEPKIAAPGTVVLSTKH